MTKSKRFSVKLLIILVDLLILIGSAYLLASAKPGGSQDFFSIYGSRFWLFTLFWILVSLWFDKYNFKNTDGLRAYLRPVLVSNFVVLGFTSIVVVLLDSFEVSRFMLFGVTGLVTLMELMLALFNSWLTRASWKDNQEELDESIAPARRKVSNIVDNNIQRIESCDEEDESEDVLEAIKEESGEEVLEYLCSHLSLKRPRSTVLSTTTRLNVVNLPDNQFTTIVNLKRINDIQRINKFFETVNSKLPLGGVFAGCAETYVMRKQRILKKYPTGLNYLIYTLDFIFNRVIPKMQITKNIYFFLTKGNNRLISRAETLGRLYSCGFEVIREDFLNGMLYFVVRKIKDPAFDYHPTYGPIIRLKRIGKNGKLIGVFKMRTMHAYSEYLQKYVFEKNSLQNGGKFADDFRVTTVGKFMRSYWLDELPMLVNLLMGDMKIVGVRPLSKHYFSLYTSELQELRTKVKPGLIPPFYVDMPVTLEEIMESERKYLEAYLKSPFLTDWKYFWKSVYNILIKRARSK